MAFSAPQFETTKQESQRYQLTPAMFTIDWTCSFSIPATGGPTRPLWGAPAQGRCLKTPSWGEEAFDGSPPLRQAAEGLEESGH